MFIFSSSSFSFIPLSLLLYFLFFFFFHILLLLLFHYLFIILPLFHSTSSLHFFFSFHRHFYHSSLTLAFLPFSTNRQTLLRSLHQYSIQFIYLLSTFISFRLFVFILFISHPLHSSLPRLVYSLSLPFRLSHLSIQHSTSFFFFQFPIYFIASLVSFHQFIPFHPSYSLSIY